MEFKNPEALVDVEWLGEHLDDETVKIIDATYHLPISERDAAEEFEFRHIPGSVFFDIDDICDKGTDLPHMIPTPDVFAEKVGSLGISNDDKLVIYDGSGGFLAAARAWWMFRMFGHQDVCVLDGGLPQWGKKKKPLEHGPVEPEATAYSAAFNPAMVRTMSQMLENMESGEEQVLDARNERRFTGVDWEPRPTKRLGHIPGSINLPFPELMVARKDFLYRPAEEIATAFANAGVDWDKPIVATCGSGITACVLAFAAHLMGHDQVSVYDGSWAEWGNTDDTPIEV